jgi:hypothetical protein
MIEKKPGIFALEKLRTIHLFEADCNWLLGLIFGRNMACSAEEQHHLFDSQWGARLGRSTEQPDLHKTMSYKISRLIRTSLAKHNRGCLPITYFAVCPQTPRDVTTCLSRVESF